MPCSCTLCMSVLGDGAEGGGDCCNVKPVFANLHLSRCRYGLIQKTRTRRRRVCLACASRDGAPSHQSFSHRRPTYVSNIVLCSALCNKYHQFICDLVTKEPILYLLISEYGIGAAGFEYNEHSTCGTFKFCCCSCSSSILSFHEVNKRTKLIPLQSYSSQS